MTTEEIDLVVGALDSLGVTLADHGHQWTDGDRAIYEESIKILWNEFNKFAAPSKGRKQVARTNAGSELGNAPAELINAKLDEIDDNADKVAHGMHTIQEGNNVPDDCMNVVAALRIAIHHIQNCGVTQDDDDALQAIAEKLEGK